MWPTEAIASCSRLGVRVCPFLSVYLSLLRQNFPFLGVEKEDRARQKEEMGQGSVKPEHWRVGGAKTGTFLIKGGSADL